jgi:hypothetical protein
MSVDSSQMSKEDKFFGVNAPLQIPEKETKEVESDWEVEVVDDLPKKPAKQEAKEEDNDEELSDYSEKVRKRINKLKYEQHEAQRQREAAEKMREEAVRIAQQLTAKNQHYESLIQRGEGALVQQIKSRASLALEQAKAHYKEAYEQGDAEKIIAAQEKLLNAQTEFREAGVSSQSPRLNSQFSNRFNKSNKPRSPVKRQRSGQAAILGSAPRGIGK